MLDVIIKNAVILDGSGDKRYKGDLGIKKDRIEKIGELSNEKAKKIIDATGKLITPGFVDILNQSDSYLGILKSPSLESLIRQGITTILVGHCGSSLAPLGSRTLNNVLSKWAGFFSTIVLPPNESVEALKSIRRYSDITGVNINWITVKEYLKEIEKKGIAVNMATLVGHSTIRRNMVKDEKRQLTEIEISHFQEVLEDSIQEGAFGLSTGLTFAHSYFVDTKELVELSKTLKAQGGKHYINLRQKGDGLTESVLEVVDIAKNTGVGVEISYFKTSGKYKKEAEEALKIMEKANQEGLEVNFDFYPYDHSWSVLYTNLPRWAYDGSREDLLKRLENKETYQKILAELKKTKNDFQDFTISSCPYNQTYVGRTIEDVAKTRNISSEEAVLDVLKGCQGHAVCLNSQENDTILDLLAVHPLSIIVSGGAGYSADYEKEGQLIHPRCFGAFPRFIKRYVKEKKLLSFEKAIQKMTSMPALKAGIIDRGFIEENMKADLVLMDEKNITDRATYDNPFLFPEGIEMVMVNGAIAFENGTLSKNFYGQIIRK